MPKNKGKGGKKFRKGKHAVGVKKPLIFKEDGQEYAKILKILGNCRVHTLCMDGKERIAHIRGAMRKRVWISKDDTVLVGLRDFQDEKADVIHKYTTSEVTRLEKLGEIDFNKQKSTETEAFLFEDI